VTAHVVGTKPFPYLLEILSYMVIIVSGPLWRASLRSQLHKVWLLFCHNKCSMVWTTGRQFYISCFAIVFLSCVINQPLRLATLMSALIHQ
jgi:hypothetical protein